MTEYGPCAPYLSAEQARALCPCQAVPAPEEGSEQPDLLDRLLRDASRRIFMATGYRFWGSCSATIRPCRTSCSDPMVGLQVPADWPVWPYPAIPVPVGPEAYVNVWACGCAPGPGCSCSGWDTIPLPMLPVQSITSVQIGTEVLDPTAYRLVAGAWLQRIDGGRWPSCQETGPIGTEGTWAVTFVHGLALPPEAEILVALYACELAKLCGGGDCALDPGIRVVQRDGVEYEIVEPADYREKGLLGFKPLDDWIALLNGPNTTTPPRVYRAGRQAPSPILEPQT